ncbi:hypothetical protein P4B35_08560 [Pontiellaceae bacterium B12227]|nr:hypothetical protein [Pontiellaceae bacterium B12227]
MKKWIAILMAVVFANVSQGQEVVHAWHYDGLGIDAAVGLSAAGSTGTATSISFGDKPLAAVTNERVRWAATGAANESAFITKTPTLYAGQTTGEFQLELDFEDADFSLSSVANGDARIGIGIRSKASGNDDGYFRLRFDGRDDVTNIVAGVTNVVNYDELYLEVKDDISANVKVAELSGPTLTNLNIRATYDLNNKGNAGSFKVYYSLDGAPEVLAYSNGVLAADFKIDQLRWAVQSSNGGAAWTVGDDCFTDNLIFSKLADPEPPPALVGLIEEWTFDHEPNGTLFEGLTNTAPDPFGLGAWSGDKDQAFVSNGVLRFEQGSSDTDNVYRNSTLSQSGITNGQFQLSWVFTDADVSSSTNNGYNCGFGLRDNTLNQDAFLLRLQKLGDKLRMETRVGNSNTAFKFLGTNVLEEALAVRVVADYDSDTFDVFYTQGGGVEKVATNGMSMYASNMTLDGIRMVAVTETNAWGPTDFFEVDDLQLSVYDPNAFTPQGRYNTWLLGYQPTLGAATNMVDNPDMDELNNLGEYAFGGDPTDDGDIGYLPSYESATSGGTNYIDYVYIRRKDSVERGLTYTLQLNTDLANGTWTNDVSLYENIGAADLPGSEFRAITNRVNTEAGARFIRTDVTFAP